jgi:2-keto-4-pentenoate hydratase
MTAVDREAADLARRLVQARASRVPVPRPSRLSQATAAAAREKCIELLTDDGRIAIAGYKVSLSTGTWGALAADVVVRGVASLPRASLIDPLLECELAFVVEAELPAPSTRDDILDRCLVGPAIEIADSRWEAWRPSDPERFAVPSAAEIEADNAVGGWLVVGDSLHPARALPLAELQISTRTAGRTVARGRLGEVMGHPADAVAWLIRQLATSGRALEVGQVVSSGCPCSELVTVPPEGGTWEAVVDGIGVARVTFT